MTGTFGEAAPDDRATKAGPGRTRKRRPSLHQRWKLVRRAAGLVFARTIAPATLKLLAKTWSYETLFSEHHATAREHGGGFIIALWHGRMLALILPFYRQDVTILVSGSRDGDLSEALLEGFRFKVIRGSSSKGGARALRQMITALEGGSIVAITPDGPRGPRHSMNPGLAWMARATGFPILPAGIACDRAWRLSSWDAYSVPKPRARIAVAWGPPVSVPRDSSPEDMEQATREIRERIMAAERAGFAHLGMEPDF